MRNTHAHALSPKGPIWDANSDNCLPANSLGDARCHPQVHTLDASPQALGMECKRYVINQMSSPTLPLGPSCPRACSVPRLSRTFPRQPVPVLGTAKSCTEPCLVHVPPAPSSNLGFFTLSTLISSVCPSLSRKTILATRPLALSPLFVCVWSACALTHTAGWRGVQGRHLSRAPRQGRARWHLHP